MWNLGAVIGISGSIGARELADVCQALETAGKDEDWNMMDEGVPNLDHLMEDVESYINALWFR